MSNQLNDQERKTVENFEQGSTFQQLPPEVRDTYHQLDELSKHIFVSHIERDWRKIEAEEWRGENGKQKERDWILKEQVPPGLKSLLAEQESSNRWRRKLAEEIKAQDEARQSATHK